MLHVSSLLHVSCQAETLFQWVFFSWVSYSVYSGWWPCVCWENSRKNMLYFLLICILCCSESHVNTQKIGFCFRNALIFNSFDNSVCFSTARSLPFQPPGPQLSAPKGIVNVYFPTNSSVFIINVGLSHFVVGFLKRQQTQQSSNKSVVGTALVFAPHSSTHSHTQCEWHTKFKPILIFDCEKKNILSRSPSNAICFIFPFGGCFFPICVRVFFLTSLNEISFVHFPSLKSVSVLIGCCFDSVVSLLYIIRNGMRSSTRETHRTTRARRIKKRIRMYRKNRSLFILKT